MLQRVIGCGEVEDRIDAGKAGRRSIREGEKRGGRGREAIRRQMSESSDLRTKSKHSSNYIVSKRKITRRFPSHLGRDCEQTI